MTILEKRTPTKPHEPHPVPYIEDGIVQPAGFPGLPEGWVSEAGMHLSADQTQKNFSILHRRKNLSGLSHVPRALVVLHGLGEHGGRYHHFPHYLNKTVDAVLCLDHRGHGRSEGIRGHVERFDAFAEDVAAALFRFQDQLRKESEAFEIHFFGHSMGGLIALRTLYKFNNLPIASAAVSAPLLGIRARVPVIKKTVGKFLAHIWGSLQLSSELDPTVLSHDPAVVEAYIADRLVHNKVTPLFFNALEAAMDDTFHRETRLLYPLQMMIPLGDQLVDSDRALEFFKKLNASDKTLKTYPKLFHEPFNEIGKEKLFEDLSQWIKMHPKVPTSSAHLPN